MSARSFKDVNGKLTRIAESVVNHLANGSFKRRGTEMIAGDIHGAPGESFALNISKGTWADFADSSGDQAGDMIDYWAAVRGIKKGEAKREAEEWLYGQEPAPPPKADNYIPWKDGHMAGKWTYTTADGEPWMTVYRFNDPSKPGAKDFCPWDDHAKIWKMPDGVRPLFNLPAVIQAVRSGQQVIVVEGEKKAQLLNDLGYVATTSASGSRSAHKTDWTPLAGANVVIWPDHDSPGVHYGEVVTQRLKAVQAANVRKVAPPAEKPEGWDAGDADVSECRGLIATAEASEPELKNRPLRATPFILPNSADIPQREWVYGHHLIRKFVSLTVAPGACGKSSLLIADALAMATGRDILGVPVYGGKLNVWLWNLEDPADELTRRIVATAQHYGIVTDNISGRLFVDSGRDQGLCLARQTRDGVEIMEPVAEALVAEIKARQIDVLVVDPFISSHLVSENDNGAIDAVAKQWGAIADRAECAIEIVHHLRKTNGMEANAESARGAVSLVAAARSVRVLNRMTAEEAVKAGLDNHRGYFRVLDDKNNLAPAADRAEWFKIVPVDLPNGDSVGVVTRWTWPDPFADVTAGDLLAVQHAIHGKGYRANVQAKEWVGHAIAAVLNLDCDDASDRTRIKTMIKKWMANGALVKCEQTDESRKKRPVIEVGVWVNAEATPP